MALADDDKRYDNELKTLRDQKETTVLSSTFSNDGQWLVCGSKTGRINVFRLNAKSPTRPEPELSFAAHSGAIYSLEFVPTAGGSIALVSGGDTEIRGWNWSQLLTRIEGEIDGSAATAPSRITPLFELIPTQHKGTRGSVSQRAETNALAYDASSNLLYSACGDGVTYAWDVTSEKLVRSFVGHTDAVYCLALATPSADTAATIGTKGGALLATGSEDGYIRLWDTKTGACLRVLDPNLGTSSIPSPVLIDLGNTSYNTNNTSSNTSDEKTATTATTVAARRPWVSCMAMDDTGSWLVAGGGARFLSVWNIQTLAITAVLPTAGTPQAVNFDGDNIISVGNESYVYHWKKAGKLTARVKANSPSLFSIANWRSTTNPMIVVSGNTPAVDVYLNPTISAFQLTFK